MLIAAATLCLSSLVLVILDPSQVASWLTLLATIGFCVVLVLRLRDRRRSEHTRR